VLNSQSGGGNGENGDEVLVTMVII
jgi:hypothetical protein